MKALRSWVLYPPDFDAVPGPAPSGSSISALTFREVEVTGRRWRRLSKSFALAAEALHVKASIGAFAHAADRIYFVVWMALRAVRPMLGMRGLMMPVMFVRDWLQMFYGHTARVLTYVMEVVAFSELTDHLFIHESIALRGLDLPPEVAITVTHRTHPVQALRVHHVRQRRSRNTLEGCATQIHGSYFTHGFHAAERLVMGIQDKHDRRTFQHFVQVCRRWHRRGRRGSGRWSTRTRRRRGPRSTST